MLPEWFSQINAEPTPLTREIVEQAIEEIRTAPPKKLKLFTSSRIYREAVLRYPDDVAERMRWISDQRGSYWDWV